MIAVYAAFLSGTALMTATPASAGGCNWATPCGEVNNRSVWTLRYTTTLGSGPHYCDVWNWNGGSSPVWRHARCTQENLGAGGSRGGGTVDVDAFTYADRDYLLDFHGTLSWRTKGVWTKIVNTEEAYCYTDYDLGVPMCEVVWEL